MPDFELTQQELFFLDQPGNLYDWKPMKVGQPAFSVRFDAHVIEYYKSLYPGFYEFMTSI